MTLLELQVNALSPVISKDKYGVMYALVLAQGILEGV